MQLCRKMFFRFAMTCMLCSYVCPVSTAANVKAELKDADVDRLIELLEPSPHERWRKIPWKISLLDGQKTAVEQGKPIFIWAMDGHPLGCT